MRTQIVARKFAVLTCLTGLFPCGAGSKDQPGAGTHPIVDVESGYLLGGSAGRKWVSDQAAAKSLHGGETYRLYSATRALGTMRGGKPKGQGAPCPETLFVDLAPKPGGKAMIAIVENWNALPRMPQILPTTSPVYRTVIMNELRRHGLPKPTVKIDQIWRVDLDGDGQDEVIISANNYAYYEPGAAPPSASRAGDYSLLLVRRVVGGRVRTFVLNGQYYLQAKTFNAPDDTHIAACLDVNGDGRMEIIMRDRYYEGHGTSVLEMGADGFKSVLSSACGA